MIIESIGYLLLLFCLLNFAVILLVLAHIMYINSKKD